MKILFFHFKLYTLRLAVIFCNIKGDLIYYGNKINLLIDIQVVNEKFGKNYKIKSSFMVFLYMKLKCNTLIGGWQK